VWGKKCNCIDGQQLQITEEKWCHLVPSMIPQKTIVLTARENRSIPTLHILALNSQSGHLLLIPHTLRKCPNGRAGSRPTNSEMLSTSIEQSGWHCFEVTRDNRRLYKSSSTLCTAWSCARFDHEASLSWREANYRQRGRGVDFRADRRHSLVQASQILPTRSSQLGCCLKWAYCCRSLGLITPESEGHSGS
jgi:hypothetical protein